MTKKLSTLLLAFSFMYTVLTSCGGNESKTTNNNDNTTAQITKLNVPDFNSDTAFSYIEKQLSFGFRTPGSKGQKQCADWMEQMLKQYCDTVYRQNATVVGGDGKKLPCYNLIGSINPNATFRILFLTHWDSRPWADMDEKDKDKPILAADDAASGVGVLLEIAKKLKEPKISSQIGIDIFFTDVEDYGKTEWGDDSYCLGTQYWANNLHLPGYKANFGILLDMVGARGASFPLEMISKQYAGEYQKEIYQAAHRAGYSSYFPFVEAGGITDDHKYVNELTGIPTIDIININAYGSEPFKPHWHTHKDNLDIIDKNTLKAVGQSMLQVIYENIDKIEKNKSI